MEAGDHGILGELAALHVVEETKLEEENVIVHFQIMEEKIVSVKQQRPKAVTQIHAARTFGLQGSVKIRKMQATAERTGLRETA